MNNASETVLVTGATGFIARHVIAELLRAGYTVRGTVRATSSFESLRADLATVVGVEDLDRFSVVAANLLAGEGWDEAVAGCAFVHHVASPIPNGPPKNDDELVIPAREGTLRVLRASKEAGVRRVVVTSSVAAVIYGVNRDKTFGEADWSNPNDRRIGAYEKSKTYAERAAWDFVKDGGPELATVNPGLVLGPGIGGDVSTSLQAVAKLLQRDVPAVPNLTFAVVDVRDVAAAHVAAMTADWAPGRRFLAGGPNVSLRDLAAILATAYNAKGYRVPTGKLPSAALKIVALFDKTVQLAMNDLDNPVSLDNAPILQLLGRPLRGLEEMTLASAETLIEYGLVKLRRR